MLSRILKKFIKKSDSGEPESVFDYSNSSEKIGLLQAELAVQMMTMTPLLQIKRPVHLNKFLMVLVKE